MIRSEMPGRAGRIVALAGCLVLVAVLIPGPDAGAQERIPRLQPGMPIALLPVQSVRPLPGGGWPGGADSRSEAMEALNAELNFAVQESGRLDAWESPGEVVRALRRNPMLKVEPRRLAWRVPLRPGEGVISEPLRGQLRSISAITNTRLAILPLTTWYETPDTTDRSENEHADEAPPEGATARGWATVEVVVVDTRAGAVLWRGRIRGAMAPPDSPAALATLASRLVAVLMPS